MKQQPSTETTQGTESSATEVATTDNSKSGPTNGEAGVDSSEVKVSTDSDSCRVTRQDVWILLLAAVVVIVILLAGICGAGKCKRTTGQSLRAETAETQPPSPTAAATRPPPPSHVCNYDWECWSDICAFHAPTDKGRVCCRTGARKTLRSTYFKPLCSELPLGAPCWGESSLCQSELVCSGGYCAAAIGKNCSADEDCNSSDLVCLDDTCQEFSPPAGN